MTVYGDGKQTRSFQYVSDLVSITYSATLFAALGKERASFSMDSDKSLSNSTVQLFHYSLETSRGALNSRISFRKDTFATFG